MSVTAEQIKELHEAITSALDKYSDRTGEACFWRAGNAGKYWWCETALVHHGKLQYMKDRKPGRQEFKPAAILDTETGRFVKGGISAKGVRIAKGQPTDPPTIDNYTINNCGAIAGKLYPKRYRIEIVSSVSEVRT